MKIKVSKHKLNIHNRGGPINGEAHKVGIYKLEVYGRFKGWGSR